MIYGLFNKKLNKHLTHPKVGLWSTQSLPEAEDMLQACLAYVKTLDVPDYEQSFIIVDLEAEECLKE